MDPIFKEEAREEENKAMRHPIPFEATILLFSVFIVGLCTIVYELLIGSISSYLLGDSIKQFSITIGLTMAGMGVGTLLSRHIHRHLLNWFVFIEIVLGFLGGLSVPLLFAAYPIPGLYYPVMISLIVMIGVLIGLEIPLLTRAMEGIYSLRANISNVLSLDYFGALAASVLFPFLLLPFLGLFQSSIITGIANVGIGVLNLWWFRAYFSPLTRTPLWVYTAIVSVILFAALFNAKWLTGTWETNLFEDRVVYSKQTQYQKIILTKNRNDIRLYLDGHLQFSSKDEYRYHEALIHVPLSMASRRERVLVLGGGDGLAVRDILKHSGVREVVLVDLDPEVIRMATTLPLMRRLNEDSLQQRRVKVLEMDAFLYLQREGEVFDLIIADLPDPRNVSLSRLYSREFFTMARSRLSRQGIFVTQATSPYFAKKAFWSIKQTVESAGFRFVLPYHVYVPSFGDWGFVLASQIRPDPGRMVLQVPTRFLNQENLRSIFIFPKDIVELKVVQSTLNRPEVLRYYLAGWKEWE